VGLEAHASGIDVEGVVDGVAEWRPCRSTLPVFKSGDDVFDAGADAAVLSPMLIADDPAGAVVAGG
jgi:hypothetical protein